MPQNLLHTSRPHTVMEWLFTGLVEPVYTLAQRLGLLTLLDRDTYSVAELAQQLSLSERGLHCVLHCLTAAVIVTQKQERYRLLSRKIPDTLLQTAQGLQNLLQALEAGVFQHATAQGELPADAPHGLVFLGIARIVDTHLYLTEPGQHYFTPGTDTYLGGYVRHAWNLLSSLLTILDEVVRTGKPGLRAEKNPGFFGPLVETLFPLNFEAAQQLTQLLPRSGIQTILDLGAGSAVWSIALAQQNSHLQITAMDLPPVLDITRTFLQRQGVSSQFRLVAGDFFAHDVWNDQPYDIIYLGYLCCGFSPEDNQRLLRSCLRNLRPNGTLVLIDYLPKPDYSGSILDVFFSVLMLSVTDAGETYPAQCYDTWCHEAGFAKCEWVQVEASSSPILLAHAPAANNIPSIEQLGRQEQSVQATATIAALPFVPPTHIIETTFAFAQSCILLAAVELNIFTAIANGNETSTAIAAATEVDVSALTRLLGALQAMGFVQHTHSGYALMPISERYLVTTRTTYVGDVARQIRKEWDAWINLSEIVRTGKPARYINEEPVGGPFFEELVEHLFPLVYPLMRHICVHLGIGTTRHALQVVDLGAGTAPGAIAALELDTQARASAIDFAPVLERARIHAQQHGVNERMQYISADLETIELPENHFDLAIIGHTLRILGEEVTQKLLQQCYRSLKPGGQLVIVETYKEVEREWKLFPHIISVNMLVNTHHGDAFSSQQMNSWLREAGFQVEVWAQAGPDPILIATRP